VIVGNECVTLFENTPSGVMVTTDENLDNYVKIAAEKCCKTEDQTMIVKKEAIEQAKNYTRAIGRIMLHALATKQTLPNNAMPPFLINCESVTAIITLCFISLSHSKISFNFPVLVMFHGYDNDYEPNDILNHIEMLEFAGEKTLCYLLNSIVIDEDGEPWTRETFFAKFIPAHFINTRKILLGCLQDGLTFGGKADPSREIEKGCGLSSHFSIIPLEAIQHTYFARPEISVEDLIADVLEPKYGEGGE
jgi:hypothetical protein